MVMARVNAFDSGALGIAPRPPQSAPPSSHDATKPKGRGARRSLLCATLLPVFVGVLAIAVLQFVAHQEVLRGTYTQVLDEAAQNAALHLDQHFDDAVVCTRAASAHFASRPGWVGTPAADAVLLGILRVVPKAATVVVASGSGLLSGAGRMEVRHRLHCLASSRCLTVVATVLYGLRTALSLCWPWRLPRAGCRPGPSAATPARWVSSTVLCMMSPAVHGSQARLQQST